MGDGIGVSDSGTDFTNIILNYVGTNQNGDPGLGNSGDGIHLTGGRQAQIGSQTLSGSVGDAQPESAGAGGNVIGNNSGAGVAIEGASTIYNQVSANSIDDNGGQGIALIGGGNDNQGAPLLTSALSSGGSTEIKGTLNGSANAPYVVEFFASPNCDPSGSGEGHDYLGFEQVMADGTGTAPIDVTFSVSTGGQTITATAMNDGGDTSAFSQCITATGPTPTPSPTHSPTPTQSATPTPTANPSPTPTGSAIEGDANCDGTVTIDDALATLSQIAGVSPGAPCADRGDTDCDHDLDGDDALRILAYKAGAPLPKQSGCPSVGAET
jgi:hypothetical protein